MKREIVDETGIDAFVKEAVGVSVDPADKTGVKSSVHGDGQSRLLPRICSNGRQLRDISNDALRALQALNEPPQLFVRSGMLVAIVRNEKQRQVISEVGVDALCGRLARCADYFKVSASGDEYNCPPPPGVVKDILALAPGEWKFQSLDAVTDHPPEWQHSGRSRLRPGDAVVLHAGSKSPSADARSDAVKGRH